MEIYNQIFENNQKWIESKEINNKGYFSDLSKGQSPEILYIGCSDSRVTAEEMTGVEPGQMFVHRNIANLVPNNDINSEAVVEYAINFIKVKHVVVCGHYNCGGVKAAMEAKDLGILNPWLRNIRDVYRLHKDTLNAIGDQEGKYKKLVELNVLEQCINIIKTAALQRAYLSTGYPVVHGWVFDIWTGKLIDLNIDFKSILTEVRKIYDLGTE
jgi:carbonic anhydrase